MSDLIWLTEAQMLKIEPYFPLSHGVLGSMIGGLSAGLFLSFRAACPGATHHENIARTRRSTIGSSARAGWACSTQFLRRQII
jgi:hypothetical protein